MILIRDLTHFHMSTQLESYSSVIFVALYPSRYVDSYVPAEGIEPGWQIGAPTTWCLFRKHRIFQHGFGCWNNFVLWRWSKRGLPKRHVKCDDCGFDNAAGILAIYVPQLYFPTWNSFSLAPRGGRWWPVSLNARKLGRLRDHTQWERKVRAELATQ